MAASKASRATKFRRNREARGFKSISVTISPEAKKALETLQVTRDWAQWEAVSEALVYAARQLAGFTPSQAVDSAPIPEAASESAERARETGELLEMKKLILGFEERMGELERRLREAGATTAPAPSEESPTSHSQATAQKGRAEVSQSEQAAAGCTVRVRTSGKQERPDRSTTGEGPEQSSAAASGPASQPTSQAASQPTGEPTAPANAQPTAPPSSESARDSARKPSSESSREQASESPRESGSQPATAAAEPDEEAILDFAARAFREHGMTISRGRTYRMAQQQGIRVHESEEEYGRFLQSNLAEISRRLKELMAKGE